MSTEKRSHFCEVAYLVAQEFLPEGFSICEFDGVVLLRNTARGGHELRIRREADRGRQYGRGFVDGPFKDGLALRDQFRLAICDALADIKR